MESKAAEDDEETTRSPASVIEWDRFVDPDRGYRKHHNEEDPHSLVFPPINHENLLPNSHPKDRETSHSRREDNHPSPVSIPTTHQAQVVDVARWLGLGLDLLRAKVNGFISSFRKVVTDSEGTAKLVCSSVGAVAVVATLMAVLLSYIRLRRKRRLELRRESVDDLIRLARDKDEKLDQLLHQVSKMNELLLALHRVSSSAKAGKIRE